MLTGTNLVYTKKYNLRIVHEVIRLHGPLSRDRRKIRSGPVGPSTPVQERRLPYCLWAPTIRVSASPGCRRS